MKFRNELKYRLNFQDYTLIKSRLEAICKKDTNVTPAGFYTVRSLYFDDYQNTAYNEKLMGVTNRQKFRIRIYNHSDQSIQLERKIKSNQYIHKQSSPLLRDQVYDILQGRYEFLLNSKDNLLGVFYYELITNLLRPRVVVEYEREPFIADVGQLRITFDRNIRAGEMGFDIFDPKMPMIEALDPGLVILEVKYTDILPAMIRRILPSKASEFGAISKYILCCDLTMHKRNFYSYA
jgi:hypothetical protein